MVRGALCRRLLASLPGIGPYRGFRILKDYGSIGRFRRFQPPLGFYVPAPLCATRQDDLRTSSFTTYPEIQTACPNSKSVTCVHPYRIRHDQMSISSPKKRRLLTIKDLIGPNWRAIIKHWIWSRRSTQLLRCSLRSGSYFTGSIHLVKHIKTPISEADTSDGLLILRFNTFYKQHRLSLCQCAKHMILLSGFCFACAPLC